MKITLTKLENYITINEIKYYNYGKGFTTIVKYENYGVKNEAMFNKYLTIDKIIIELNDMFEKEVK